MRAGAATAAAIAVSTAAVAAFGRNQQRGDRTTRVVVEMLHTETVAMVQMGDGDGICASVAAVMRVHIGGMTVRRPNVALVNAVRLALAPIAKCFGFRSRKGFRERTPKL